MATLFLLLSKIRMMGILVIVLAFVKKYGLSVCEMFFKVRLQNYSRNTTCVSNCHVTILQIFVADSFIYT